MSEEPQGLGEVIAPQTTVFGGKMDLCLGYRSQFLSDAGVRFDVREKTL
jgi:hypothetical protein